MRTLSICLLLFINVYAQGDFTQCDAYLRKYGYLIDGKSTPASTEDREVALRVFQRFAGLPRTGLYDDATKAKMELPRCGCLDIMHNRTAPGAGPASFRQGPQDFNAGPNRWRRNALTWRLVTPLGGNTLTVAQQRDAMTRAFQLWADQTPLTFREITSGTADIRIEFAGRNHNIGRGDEGFDGSGGVLAHAFFPEDGRAHFDNEERWVINSNNGIELFIVAAHEFGHNLGLGHSEVQSALMAPFYAGFTPNFRLDSDDIAGIRTLYGGPVTNQPPPPTTRRTTARPTQPPVATTSATRSFICDVPFTAAMRVYSGDLFAFIGFRSLIVIRENEGLIWGPHSSRNVFQRSPRRPDAAFNILSTAEYFIVRGLRNFRYDNMGRRNGRPDWIVGGTTDMPERPRAVMSISRNEIYMFGATQVWNWDSYEDQVMDGTHSYIGEEFPGLPDMLDAATAWNETTAYFFKGTEFYTYDLVNRRLVSGPSDTGSFFMPNICGSPN